MIRGTFLLGKINRGIVNVTSFFNSPTVLPGPSLFLSFASRLAACHEPTVCSKLTLEEPDANAVGL